MMLDRMEGNAELKTSVQQMLATRRLTHSVLLVGDAGRGTGFAARCIAADYLYPAGGAAAEALLRGECCRAVAKAGQRDRGEIHIHNDLGFLLIEVDVSGAQRGEIVLERRLVRAAKVGAAAAVIVPYVHIAQGEVFRRPAVEAPRRTGLRAVGLRHMPGAERQQQKRPPDEERARVLLPRRHDVFEPIAQGAGRGGQAGGEAALVARGL